jgi:hypothetical protein
MPIIKGVTLQDIHWGNKDSDRMYAEISPFFLDYLKNNEVHILNLNGDYFDRKLTATEPAIFYAITFFDDMMKICVEKNIKVRIILGTRSHDLNQYTTLFQHYFTRSDLDIKYISEVQEEELLGVKILYLPEEYPEDEKEYYKEYKTKSYNIIHGHGMWDFVAFTGPIDEEKTGVRGAPIFVYEEWKNTIKNGLAIFGHIHKRQNHHNVYYSGSFTAWGYGDVSSKGFTAYEIDTDKNIWNFKYIDNPLAPKYESVSVKEIFKGKDLSKLTIEEIQKSLNEQIEGTDNLKIDLAGLPEETIKIFKKSLEGKTNVKVEVKQKKALLTETVEPAIYDKYGYILKRELPLNETIQRFIEEELKEKLTIDEIKSYLQP